MMITIIIIPTAIISFTGQWTPLSHGDGTQCNLFPDLTHKTKSRIRYYIYRNHFSPAPLKINFANSSKLPKWVKIPPFPPPHLSQTLKFHTPLSPWKTYFLPWIQQPIRFWTELEWELNLAANLIFNRQQHQILCSVMFNIQLFYIGDVSFYILGTLLTITDISLFYSKILCCVFWCPFSERDHLVWKLQSSHKSVSVSEACLTLMCSFRFFVFL